MTNPFELPSVLTCPSCGRTNGVPSRGGSFDCMFCGARIDMPSAENVPDPAVPVQPGLHWPDLERPAAPRSPASRPASKAISPSASTIPRGVSIDPGAAELLSYRWYNSRAIMELVFAGLTAAFFVFLFLFTTGIDNFSDLPWLLLLFVGTFLISTLSTIYRGVARLLNTTTLRLESGVLQARHRPIPWSGARVDVDAIERIEVDQRRVQQGRRGSTVRYDLVAHRTDGRKVVLVPGLNSAADGEQMKARLDQRLSLGR